MRIVSGRLGGMQLGAVTSDATRPTSDANREAIFSMIGSRQDLTGVKVVDLYAGTGALGIEAFSRGAASVTFVETDKKACVMIEGNVLNIKKYIDEIDGLFDVVRAPVLTFVQNDDNREKFDVAFVDPPYDTDIETEVINAIAADGLLVYETSSQQLDVCCKELENHSRVKEILVSREMGTTGVVIARIV
jgi:16S rRNA (guanine966-N2)-methyltransferase